MPSFARYLVSGQITIWYIPSILAEMLGRKNLNLTLNKTQLISEALVKEQLHKEL